MSNQESNDGATGVANEEIAPKLSGLTGGATQTCSEVTLHTCERTMVNIMNTVNFLLQ